MEASKQRDNLVLFKEKRDRQNYIRVDYARKPAIALLLSQDSNVEMSQAGFAYIKQSAFILPAFYDRYSPHAYIDYNRVYVRHPKPQREYVLPEGSVGLRRSELLNLTPQDIISERMLVRIMGKGWNKGQT